MIASSPCTPVHSLLGGGTMGQQIRDTDWSQTAWGDYWSWPAALRSALSLVLNAKGIAALLWGPHQGLLYNDACGDALGDIHPKAFGCPLSQVSANIATALGPQVTHVIATGKGCVIHNLLLTMDHHGRAKETVWTCSLSPVQGEGEGFAGVVLIANDVTAPASDPISIENALRQSQKLEAIGQLTGGVAHDFNNLLTVIKSSTELLKRPNLPEDKRARYLKIITETTDRAAQLTAQLLAFARRQALQPEVFAACDAVRSLSSMMASLSGSRIKVTTELPEEVCFVSADPSQFDTALINMVANARDAMGGQGHLTIRIEPVDKMPAIRSHGAAGGGFVAVSISDTGHGIAVGDMDKIFEPFFTTRAVGEGTGLGLSQVFGFAKQSGGEVMVRSQVGQGTTFTLYLPRVPAPDQVHEDLEPEALPDGHGTCVLVVEDNVDVAAIAMQTLSDLGYLTVLAHNADEALTELVKDSDRFDIVFSDVLMPGMDGIDLACKIRHEYHDLPVLLTSGYSHVLVTRGTSGFELLHKPYSIKQLSRLLRKVVASQS